ncbi:MAG TPA: hypothetical protein VMU77_05315, partial [Acidimicrobiales bacterium]|nr:hypothetical protein [Acidimicrobiales bacterium]
CRSRIADAVGNTVLVHAAPPELDVTVRDQEGLVIAQGLGLVRGQPGPISFLHRQGANVTLVDGWPEPDDIGKVVLLPGGEAGVLTAWWHAEDLSEWRWSVEFYNHQ